MHARNKNKKTRLRRLTAVKQGRRDGDFHSDHD
jgi:hypothetical protein